VPLFWLSPTSPEWDLVKFCHHFAIPSLTSIRQTRLHMPLPPHPLATISSLILQHCLTLIAHHLRLPFHLN